MGRILRGAVCRAVAEIPIPGRDAAGGGVGELDCQRDLAGCWIGGEVGGWPRLVVVGDGDGGAVGRAGGVAGTSDESDDDRFRPFGYVIVNRGDREVGVGQACRHGAGGGQLLIINPVARGAGEGPVHRQRLGSVARAMEANDAWVGAGF